MAPLNPTSIAEVPDVAQADPRTGAEGREEQPERQPQEAERQDQQQEQQQEPEERQEEQVEEQPGEHEDIMYAPLQVDVRLSFPNPLSTSTSLTRDSKTTRSTTPTQPTSPCPGRRARVPSRRR